MTKNLIPVIAKELGVEIGEIFRIKDSDWLYRFSKERLERSYPTGCEWNESTMTIGNLQDVEVIKLPYEPRIGYQYWSYNKTWEVEAWVYMNDLLDLVYKRVGIVFRTKEEAIAARPAKYRELTGKEWKENDRT